MVFYVFVVNVSKSKTLTAGGPYSGGASAHLCWRSSLFSSDADPHQYMYLNREGTCVSLKA